MLKSARINTTFSCSIVSEKRFYFRCGFKYLCAVLINHSGRSICVRVPTLSHYFSGTYFQRNVSNSDARDIAVNLKSKQNAVRIMCILDFHFVDSLFPLCEVFVFTCGRIEMCLVWTLVAKASNKVCLVCQSLLFIIKTVLRKLKASFYCQVNRFGNMVRKIVQ